MHALGFRTGTNLLIITCALLAGCDSLFGPDEADRPALIVFTATPDGRAADEAREVFVVRPDGTGREQLTEGAFAFAPAWSPDGRRIAFNSLSEEDPNIFVMDADGSDLRRVTSGAAVKFHATWTPDGERLAFVQLGLTDELYTVPVEGGEPELLRECPRGCKWPTWSPDGERLAFVSWPESHPNIFLVDGDGSGEPVPLGTGAEYEHHPAWSPDGALLVFISDLELGFPISVARPDGSEPEALADDLAERSSPAFSPDGSRIVFYQRDRTSPDAPDAGGIYTMNLDGGDIQPIVEFLAHSFTFVTPRWRP